MSNSGAGSYSLIVLYVILGSGGMVLVGYAISSRFLGTDGPDPSRDTEGQAAYMRDVRMRNYMWIRREAKASRYDTGTSSQA